MSTIRLSGSTSGHYDLTVPAAAGTNSIDLSKLPVLAANNKLGIGTTSPTSDLHIQRTGSNASITIEETSAAKYSQYVELKDSTTSWYMANRYAITGANNSGFGIGTTSSGDMFQIDTSGRVLEPSQPSFHARSDGYPAMNIATVPFGNVFHNVGGHYSNSTYRFTAPVTGRYYLSYNIRVNHGTSGHIIHPVFMINGTSDSSSRTIHKNDTTGQYMHTSFSYIRQLNANDYVHVDMASGNSGGTMQASQCCFTGHLLG